MKLPINDELKRGIERAVSELQQPSAVAQRLVAWLNEMSQRELTKTENSRYLQGVKNAIKVEGAGGNDEN